MDPENEESFGLGDTNEIKSTKDIFGHTLFPPSDQALPSGVTLTQICQSYPNHFQGPILQRFKDAGWSGRKIQANITDQANHERFRLKKGGVAIQQPHSVFTKRLSMPDENKVVHTKQLQKQYKSRKANSGTAVERSASNKESLSTQSSNPEDQDENNVPWRETSKESDRGMAKSTGPGSIPHVVSCDHPGKPVPVLLRNILRVLSEIFTIHGHLEKDGNIDKQVNEQMKLHFVEWEQNLHQCFHLTCALSAAEATSTDESLAAIVNCFMAIQGRQHLDNHLTSIIGNRPSDIVVPINHDEIDRGIETELKSWYSELIQAKKEATDAESNRIL